jgi:Oxysterol-binding protein
MYIAAFAVSGYSGTAGRTTKPFNPLLGETFEFVCQEKVCDPCCRLRVIEEISAVVQVMHDNWAAGMCLGQQTSEHDPTALQVPAAGPGTRLADSSAVSPASKASACATQSSQAFQRWLLEEGLLVVLCALQVLCSACRKISPCAQCTMPNVHQHSLTASRPHAVHTCAAGPAPAGGPGGDVFCHPLQSATSTSDTTGCRCRACACWRRRWCTTPPSSRATRRRGAGRWTPTPTCAPSSGAAPSNSCPLVRPPSGPPLSTCASLKYATMPHAQDLVPQPVVSDEAVDANGRTLLSRGIAADTSMADECALMHAGTIRVLTDDGEEYSWNKVRGVPHSCMLHSAGRCCPARGLWMVAAPFGCSHCHMHQQRRQLSRMRSRSSCTKNRVM